MNNLSWTIGLWGALATSALGTIAGCDVEGAAGDATAETGETSELVASIELSPTHIVKFWDHGEGRGSIQETRHADYDRAAPLRLDNINIDGRPLSELYQIFAAEKSRPEVVTKLRAIDTLAARTLLESGPDALAATPLSLTARAGSSPMPVQHSGTPASAAGVEVRQAAATCVEPDWDWAGDATWFADNFCNDAWNNWHCQSNMLGWQSWGWYGWLNYFKVSDFNQSFCVPNSLVVKRRKHSLGGSTEGTVFSSAAIPARTVETRAWNATGKVEFYAKVSSTSRFGMAIDQNITYMH
jgi:hypothetical protein